MSFFLPPLCCHLIFGSKALAGPSYLHFKICIFHIDLSATGFNIGDVSHDTFCFIMHYEFLLLSPSSSQIPVPTPRLMRPSVLSGGGEIYHFNLISINKIISLLLEVTAANAILSSSDWNLRGGGLELGVGRLGVVGVGVHFTSLHFYHRGHGCRIWPFRRNLWRIWRGAVMTLFMFFKRSSLQAHEDSSETPLTPQKRMRSETRPSIGTPSFILIAIPFFSPPVSSYFFSTPPPWVNGRKSSRELTGKQLRFKLKSQQRMFSSLTWHPFSCTRPTNTQKRETGKKKYACLKKK